MVQKAYDLRLRRLSSLIGNTPLLAIEFLYRGEKCTIYAKAEYLNLTGSIKECKPTPPPLNRPAFRLQPPMPWGMVTG